MKPNFCKRFVDDSTNFYSRFKDQPDHLLQKLNIYHEKIEFTCEVSPTKFLDTKLIN